MILVAEGFSSSVYRDDGSCVRVARDAAAAAGHRRSRAVLGVLASRVGVEVPSPVELLPDDARWPHGAARSPWLDGSPLTADVEPAEVAALLARLRAVDPGRLEGVVDPYPAWCRRRLATARRGIAAVERLVDPEVVRWLRAVVDALEPALAELAAPGVVHGDLWHENLLVRGGGLTGVLDWDACGVGDPAVDLAGPWYLGDAWANALLGALGASDAERWRCSGWRVLRELDGAAWAAARQDGAELAESVAKTAAIASRLSATLP